MAESKEDVIKRTTLTPDEVLLVEYLISLGVPTLKANYIIRDIKDIPVPDNIDPVNYLTLIAMLPGDGQTVGGTIQGTPIVAGMTVPDLANWLASPEGVQWGNLSVQELSDAQASGQPLADTTLGRVIQLTPEQDLQSVQEAGQPAPPPVDPRESPDFELLLPDEKQRVLNRFYEARDIYDASIKDAEKRRQAATQQEMATGFQVGLDASNTQGIGGSPEFRNRQYQNLSGNALNSGTDINSKIAGLSNLQTQISPTGQGNFYTMFQQVLDSLTPEQRQQFDAEVTAEADAEETRQKLFDEYRFAGGRRSLQDWEKLGRPAEIPKDLNAIYNNSIPQGISTNQQRFAKNDFGNVFSEFQNSSLFNAIPELKSQGFQKFTEGLDYLKRFNQASRSQTGRYTSNFRTPTRTLRY